MIRVVVVEDQEVVRTGLVRCLDAHPQLRVAGQDVALVDLGLPDGTGVEVIEGFQRAAPSARCLVLTALDTPELMFDALRAGAKGYLLKEAKPGAICAAVLDVSAGGSPLTPRMASFIVQRFTRRAEPSEPAPMLTPREKDAQRRSAPIAYAPV